MTSGPRGRGDLTAVFSAGALGGSELFSLEYLQRAIDLGVQIDAIIPEVGTVADVLTPLSRSVQTVAVPQSLKQLSRFDSGVVSKSALTGAAGAAAHAVHLRKALRKTRGPIWCLGLRAQLAIGIQPPIRRRSVHWVVHEVVPSGMFLRGWRFAAKRADSIAAYSQAAAQQPGLRDIPVRVLATRLDLGRFTAIEPPASPPKTLGLIGDLVPLKNHLAFVELVERLSAAGTVVEGVIVGRYNATRPELEAYGRSVKEAVDRSGGRVRLTSVAPEAVPDVMEEIDVLMHMSSIPETFGRVCVEAMAAGRPVVAYDHGALSEVIADRETGYLCPVDDMRAMGNAIRALQDDPDRFLDFSENARSRAITHFGEGQTAATIGDVLADTAVPA